MLKHIPLVSQLGMISIGHFLKINKKISVAEWLHSDKGKKKVVFWISACNWEFIIFWSVSKYES